MDDPQPRGQEINLIGILNWYDENPAWLSGCIASMARAGMTHIIGLDGAYFLYPDAIKHPRSAPEQYQAISETCQAMRVGSTIHAPYEPFAGECEKRSYGFQLAESVAEEGDWYFLMDADQVISASDNLFRVLSEASEDVAEALFYERGADYEFNGHHALWPVRCIFRAIPGLHVAGRHYDYLLPDGRNLWGDAPFEPAAETRCEVEHRSRMRSAPRKAAQESYYRRRDEVGVERKLATDAA